MLFFFDIIEKLARNSHFRIILSKILKLSGRNIVNKDLRFIKVQTGNIIKNSLYIQNIFSDNLNEIIQDEKNSRMV